MLEDVYDFLGRFLIFPVDHFRSVVTRNLINNSRNRGLRGKFHLEIVQGEIRISDSKYDLQFVLLCYFLNKSCENRSLFSRRSTSLIYEFTNNFSQRMHNFFESQQNFEQRGLKYFRGGDTWLVLPPNTVVLNPGFRTIRKRIPTG